MSIKTFALAGSVVLAAGLLVGPATAQTQANEYYWSGMNGGHSATGTGGGAGGESGSGSNTEEPGVGYYTGRRGNSLTGRADRYDGNTGSRLRRSEPTVWDDDAR